MVLDSCPRLPLSVHVCTWQKVLAKSGSCLEASGVGYKMERMNLPASTSALQGGVWYICTCTRILLSFWTDTSMYIF